MITDPYRLSLSVTDASGRVTKWGPDSPDGRDVPQDYEHSTSLPGGYKDLRCSLLREFVRSNPDNNLADRVRAYGPGNETCFDGFFTAFPKAQGERPTVEPGAVGWSAILNFDTGYQMPYIDRAVSKWHPPTLARGLAIVGAGGSQGRIQALAKLGGLVWDVPPDGAYAAGELGELHYDAGPGPKIATFEYIGARSGAFTSFEAAKLFASDTEDFTGTVESYNLTLGSLQSQALSPARRYLMLRADVTAGVTPGLGWQQRYSAFAAYGSHGLTPRSFNDGGATPDGLYNCDIVADIVARTGQGILKATTGVDGSIEANTVIVPHLVFSEPTKGADAIARASSFGITPFVLPEWGVYNDLKFFWRSPNPDRLCWKATLANATAPKLEGEQLDDRFNGVLVKFTDPGGIQRIVGPPAAYWYGGTALADSTDATLVDTSWTNPITAHGLGQKWAVLELSQPCTIAGAIALGAVFLAITSQPQRRGQIELTGLLQHPTKPQLQPVCFVKAGDYIQITDAGEDSGVKRRVIGTRYTHANRTCVADVDNTPLTLDALLELLAADLVGTLGG